MHTRTQRGFTLIELMVSVAIIGVLSSVAMPGYQNMTLRTRKSERDVVLTSVKRGVGAILVRDGRFSGEFTGAWNPAGAPTTQKRPFDYAAANWKDLDLGIEGALYHRYMFSALGTAFQVWAEGDLDADTVVQRKIEKYEIRDGALMLMVSTADSPNPEFIPAGDVAF